MSNVVSLRPAASNPQSDPWPALVDGFATGRRTAEDVYWLKEVAELLGIMTTMPAAGRANALAPLEPFYAQSDDRLRFFPQYYRLLLSICLDLEDLGMPGDTGESMVQRVAKDGLARAELSDLQRAEARRLLARRGVVWDDDPGLDDRLRHFAERSATFALPNKKAAYELTHIVFYLSDYGRKDPKLSAQACTSLTFCGLLAYLDQNADLLAEVCAALRFAGNTPSPIWDAAVRQAHRAVHATDDARQSAHDGYHEFLVTGWAMTIAEQKAFTTPIPPGAVRFNKRFAPQGALRTLSECMFDLGAKRSADWAKMRDVVWPRLGQSGHAVLAAAEQSTDLFQPFFERFARAVPARLRLH